jgi:hypothetical protein
MPIGTRSFDSFRNSQCYLKARDVKDFANVPNGRDHDPQSVLRTLLLPDQQCHRHGDVSLRYACRFLTYGLYGTRTPAARAADPASLGRALVDPFVDILAGYAHLRSRLPPGPLTGTKSIFAGSQR